MCLQLRELDVGFDALGHDLEPELHPEVDDRAHHHVGFVLGARAQQERSIDLDAVHREAVHVAERRVAGAEVVDAQAEALALEPLELPLRELGVVPSRCSR